jgi:hypothetical protein
MRVRVIYFAQFTGALEPEAQQRCYTQSIQPGCDVVEDDAPAPGEALEAANREWFGDVEEPEEEESEEAMTPVRRAKEQGDPLAGYFVDDHEAGVVTVTFPCGNGGGGNT